MKLSKRRLGYLVFLAGLFILARLFILVWLFNNGRRLDFSQDYRNIQGVENITLERNGWHDFYKRCFWGLRRIDDTLIDHTDICQAGAESDDSIIELQNLIKTEYAIRQSIYSPDKKYILYCEIKYGHQGITDDEYCYYRVYEIETGKIITLYQGYREWYNLSWAD